MQYGSNSYHFDISDFQSHVPSSAKRAGYDLIHISVILRNSPAAQCSKRIHDANTHVLPLHWDLCSHLLQSRRNILRRWDLLHGGNDPHDWFRRSHSANCRVESPHFPIHHSWYRSPRTYCHQYCATPLRSSSTKEK